MGGKTMTDKPNLARLLDGVKVNDFDVEVVQGNSGGNLALYFNDHRVAGSKPWGGGTTIYSFRVQGDEVKSSGILATIRDFQTVPVVKKCLTTDAALEAAHHVNETLKNEHDSADVLTALPADVAGVVEEAGKVAERLRGLPDAVENVDRLRDEAADTIRAIIALATAQAAQIRGREAERDAKVATDAIEQMIRNLRACANGMGSFKTNRGDFGLCDDAADMIFAIAAHRDALNILSAEDVAVYQEAIARAEAAETALAAERAKVAKLVEAGDFAKFIGTDTSKDDKDLVLVTYGMLRQLRAALSEAEARDE